MSDIDYKKLGKKIAESMAEDGHIKAGVNNVISPMLEKHKRETIKEIRTMAISIGIDCDDQLENQKDFLHLRKSRISNENIWARVKGESIRLGGVGLVAFLAATWANAKGLFH